MVITLNNLLLYLVDLSLVVFYQKLSVAFKRWASSAAFKRGSLPTILFKQQSFISNSPGKPWYESFDSFPLDFELYFNSMNII